MKNRPFYTGDLVETEIIPKTTVTFTEQEGLMAAPWPKSFDAVEGRTYKISWDGTDYVCTCVIYSGGVLLLGNLGIAGAGDNTGEPFIFINQNGWVVGTIESATEHVISISEYDSQIVKIDEKYLPERGLEIPNDGNDGQILTRTTDGIAWKNAPTPPTPQISPIDEPVTIRCVSDIHGHALNGRLQFAGRNSSICGKIYAGETDLFIDAINNHNLILKTYSQIEVRNKDGNLATILARTLPITSEYSVNEVATCGAIRQQMWNGKELFLNSSTAGSTKKFKITVDDSGTISAT